MSHWTYVNGTINVSLPFVTYSTSRVREYIEWSISKVRHYGHDITGSEGPVKFFVNAGGHPDSFSSETGDGWERGYITVMGSLRDREDSQTVSETEQFLRRLAHFLDIDDVNIKVAGDTVKEFDASPYAGLYDYMSPDDEKMEPFRDKLFRIHHQNGYRFYDELLTLEKGAEIAEFITNVSPDTLSGLLNNFGIDQTIDWDFTDQRKDWFKNVGVKVRDYEDTHHEKWHRKKMYPPKPTPDSLVRDLENQYFCDGKYEHTVIEQRKLSALYYLVREAVRSKQIMNNPMVKSEFEESK